MARITHNHILQTNLQRHEKETIKVKQHVLSRLQQDDCNTKNDTKQLVGRFVQEIP